MRLASTLMSLAMLASASPADADAAALTVVAAESVYGDVAMQIGGGDVMVASILTNPDQDPHLFEASPSVARLVSGAQIVICNGIDYDPWMGRLLSASPAPDRKVIVAASLAGLKPGDNPHVWFDIAATRAVAQATAASYTTLDPSHKTDFSQRLARFEASLAPIEARIAALRSRFKGAEVSATEPVFGYLLSSLGLVSRDQALQRAVMNETEASASDVAAFETDLRSHHARFLIYNKQANNPVADQMKAIAIQAGVPVVGVSETEPRGTSYQDWLSGELNSIERVLASPEP